MKARKIFIFTSFFLLPITLNYFSPVLIVQASMENTFSIMHIIYGLMFLIALLLGSAWCSHICPFGAMQELLPDKGVKPKLFKSKFPNLKYITGTIFLLLIFLPIILHGFNKTILFYHMEDTKVTLDSMHGLILYYIITFSIIFICAILGKRIWCRYLCPMYIINYIGIHIAKLFRLPSLKIKVDTNKCINCGKCNTACQMGLDVMHSNDKPIQKECIQCGNCIANCHMKAIHRSWN